MEPMSIELNLISCKDINAFNFFQKLTLYALVSIDSNDPKTQLTPQQKQRQRSQTHRDPEEGDGTNPVWNHKAKFDLAWLPRSSLLEGSRTDLFFRFEFRHDGVILGDKIVGECRVPLLDLIRDSGFVDDVARFVSYEVRNGEGKHNGIFNFSYRLKGVWSGNHSSQTQVLEGKISGYPAVDSACESRVQYPTVEIEEPCWCSPSAAAPPPPLTSPQSYGEYNYYYPPPPQPPVAAPFPYPPPPPPPVSQYYPPSGPEAHPYPWPSGPSFEHRW